MSKSEESTKSSLEVNPVNSLTPTDLEMGLLWIKTKNGFVNVAASPEKFDAAITEYADLMDRVNWPTTHRIAAIELAENVPVYRIDPQDLPKDLQQQYDQIAKPVEAEE